ncbi:AB hydrolase superfamily protein c1039.03-like [Plakobranchus ocellatus]|uniref:AB hydrolase superfamily protein c1039.03-like n=1 Tax=Plakobranchus ocellatus TaxID=259542 RepID=A0AAV3XY93_9GAST|nr:AB hydrolase superfamily protein c1039.03-like [Plakobranchus ocellatus]
MASETTVNIWAEVEEKYIVHEETKAFTRLIATVTTKPLYTLSLDSLRDLAAWDPLSRQEKIELTKFQVTLATQLDLDQGSVEDMTIPAPHLADSIKATVYQPGVLPPVPVLMIHYRGGGLVCGEIHCYEVCLMSLVNHTGAIIVCVEYRNLPCTEDRLAPFTDAETAAQWILGNKTAVGGVANSPVGLIGESAGGQICSSLSYTFPGKFAFQVLVYPVADVDVTNSASMKEFWRIPGFCGNDMAKMLEFSQLLEEPSEANNPRVNPSAPRGSSDPPLSSSPPTLVIVAELDPLRDWGKAYARKLRDAGVRVQQYTCEGVPHCCFNRHFGFETTARRAYEVVAEFVEPFKSTL